MADEVLAKPTGGRSSGSSWEPLAALDVANSEVLVKPEGPRTARAFWTPASDLGGGGSAPPPEPAPTIYHDDDFTGGDLANYTNSASATETADGLDVGAAGIILHNVAQAGYNVDALVKARLNGNLNGFGVILAANQSSGANGWRGFSAALAGPPVQRLIRAMSSSTTVVVESGSSSTPAAPVPTVPGDYWVVARLRGRVLVVEWWNTDPHLGGAPLYWVVWGSNGAVPIGSTDPRFGVDINSGSFVTDESRIKEFLVVARPLDEFPRRRGNPDAPVRGNF